MSLSSRLLTVSGVIMTLVAGLFWSSSTSIQAAPAAEKGGEAKPVESDMHEFMEYVFQPTYKRLKAAMAAEPADNPTWKSIKADSLILAEAGNLLLIRLPEEDVADWTQQSIQVRELGGELYRAAKAKNFKLASQHYASMLKSCNACHDQFAGGEHQLAP